MTQRPHGLGIRHRALDRVLDRADDYARREVGFYRLLDSIDPDRRDFPAPRTIAVGPGDPPRWVLLEWKPHAVGPAEEVIGQDHVIELQRRLAAVPTERLLGRRGFPLEHWDPIGYLDRIRHMYDAVLFVLGEARWRHVQRFFAEADVVSLHASLTDETRGRLIKRAHDLDASLVEFHSHLAEWPASFSESDRAGLDEFVPHVRWRLKGKPYMAVVVAPTSFDALAWVSASKNPEEVHGILVGGTLHRPTGLTLKEWVTSDEG